LSPGIPRNLLPDGHVRAAPAKRVNAVRILIAMFHGLIRQLDAFRPYFKGALES